MKHSWLRRRREFEPIPPKCHRIIAKVEYLASQVNCQIHLWAVIPIWYYGDLVRVWIMASFAGPIGSAEGNNLFATVWVIIRWGSCVLESAIAEFVAGAQFGKTQFVGPDRRCMSVSYDDFTSSQVSVTFMVGDRWSLLRFPATR